MTSKTLSNGILRAIGTILLIALGAWFLYAIQSIIIYLVVSLILTLICNPVVELLKKKCRFNNTWAVITTMILLLILVALFILMFVPLIASQARSLSLLNTESIEEKVMLLYNDLNLYLLDHGILVQDLFKDIDIASYLNMNFIPSFFNGILSTISSIGIGVASVLFITFFFLKDKVTFLVGAKKIIPDNHEIETLNSIAKINDLLTRYFIGLIFQLMIVFILYYVVLLIFGVENALIIAFICAVLNIIPYVGPLISSVLAASLAMIGGIGGDFQTEILPTALYVLIGFYIVQLIDNNISQPLIFSNSTKSHPLEIFLVILTAGFISGILGMIVAVPLYTIIKVVAKEFFPDYKIVQVLTRKL
ncbi:AI-2E family transporter [Flavobacterium sp.]|jgi:predicted PurR-regulated permease PerM|uniref:AI-2E family transporter n=1 Tax=Flavobacterium sp. TaxID=239 RepID=UPI0037BFC8AC